MSTRHETFTLSGTPSLAIEVPAGGATIVAGAAGRISLSIDGSRADDLVVGIVGGAVSVTTPSTMRRFSSVRLVAEVPEGTDLSIRAASLDVRATVPLGSVSVRTASGNLKLAGVGATTARTASGDVSVEDVDGDLRVELASGDIRAGIVEGALSVSSASGDISVRSVTGHVEVSTATGDVAIDHWSGDDLLVKTVSGDVRLGVPAGTKADLDVKTLSGSVRMPDPASSPAPADSIRRRLRLSTVSGDIVIRRTT